MIIPLHTTPCLFNFTFIIIKETNQIHQAFYQLVAEMTRKTMPKNKMALVLVLVHHQPAPEAVEHQHCQYQGESHQMEEHNKLHRQRLSFRQIDNHDKVLDLPTRDHPPLGHRLYRVPALQQRHMMDTNSYHAPPGHGTRCKLQLPCCQGKLKAQDWIGPTTKNCIYETKHKLTMTHASPTTVLSPHFL